MRLGDKTPRRPLHRFLRWFLATFLDIRLTDQARTLMWQPELYGDPVSRLTERLLQGSSEWAPQDRELFGAFVSKKSQCEF